MASQQDLLVGYDENTAGVSNTGTFSATQGAPGAGFQLIITGFSISVEAAPAAASTVAIRINGGATTKKTYRLPAATFAPIIYEFKRPIKVPENQDADITAVVGAGTVRVELYTITRPVTV